MDGTIDGTTKAAVGANGLKVDGSGATQPISGTVTANIGTTGGLALDASIIALQVAQGSTTSGQKGGLTLGAVTTAAPTYTTAQTSPLSLDTSGNLRVINTPSGTQVISGTVTANQGGTWNINNISGTISLPTGAATETTLAAIKTDTDKFTFAATRLIVDGSQVTQPISGTVTATPTGTQDVNIVSTITVPISAASLPLPTGAATETTLAAIKTDTDKFTFASTRLLTDGSGVIQPVSGTVTANIGTTNGLALDATVSALQVSQGSSTSGEKGTLVLGAVTTAAPTYTTAQSSPFSLDTAGNLRVSNTPSGVQTTNVSQLNGTTVSVNSGNKDNGTLRVVLATDQPSITNPIPVTLPANISPATQNVTAQDVASVSSTGANSQKIVTGAPTAGSTASFTVTAVSTVNVQVTGSWTGTLSLESSLDGGTTWYSNGGHQKGVPFNSSSFTANFECATNVAASTNFRIRATAAWTGTATVLVVESVNDDSVYILNAQQILDGSGTNAKATVTASNALKVDGSAVTQPVGGVAAQGSSVSGNPVLIGLEARDTLGTVVATGQVVRGVADRYGRQYSIEPAVTYVSSAATPITTNTNTSTVAAPGAGNHLRIYRISAENSSSTATWMYWTEGSGGTKKFAWYLTQGSARSLNLVGSWNLPSATALFINTATTGANIEWNVGYETVAD